MAHAGFVFLLVLILTSTWHYGVNASELRYKVKEDQEPGLYIGSLALDLKLNSNSFELIKNSEEQELVRVDMKTGQIWTIQKLDREELCADIVPCEIKREVIINPSPDYIYEFVLEVEDVNDNSPTFGDVPLELTILEDVDVGRSFQLPSATDADAPPFGVMTYQLFSPDGERGSVGPFSLTVMHNQNGDGPIPYLRVDKKLDREQQEVFELLLWATDGGNPSPNVAKAVVRVIVADVNDHAPVFNRGAEIDVQIKEGVAIGTEVITLNATDKDAGEYGRVSYKFDARLSSPRSAPLFAIDSETGVVTVEKDLDRESTAVHHLIVVASDAANPPLSSTTTLSVTLLDINDNTPKIRIHIMGTSSMSTGNLEVEENKPNVSLAVVRIIDGDEGEAGRVECKLNPLWGDAPAPMMMKEIGKGQCMLQTVRLLDRETKAEYRANIIATDHGDPPLTSQLELTLHVLDQNDNDPVFSLSTYSASVLENLPVGSTIITVSASDNDQGANAEVRYRFNDSNDHQGLDIDTNSGVVTVVKPGLDREIHDVLNLSVLAFDQGEPSRVASANIVLTILDVNDNSPSILGNPLRFEVSENQLPGTEVGNVFVRDPDQGNNGLVSLKLLQGSEMFQLVKTPEFSQASGSKSVTQCWRLSTLRSLDREVVNMFNLPIFAEDHGIPSQNSSASIKVIVTDENDHDPVIVKPSDNMSEIFVAMDSRAGKSLLKIEADDVDIGPNAELRYLFISGNPEEIFDLDIKTGELKLKKAAKNAGEGLYRLVVEVHDGGTPNGVSLPGIVHVLINQTNGNRSLIEDMKARSMSHPIHEDVVLGRNTKHSLPLWVYLACGIGLLVVLLVVGLCIVLLCCKKDKKGANKQKASQGKRKQRTNRGVARGSISEEPLSLPLQGRGGFGSDNSPIPLSPDQANLHFLSRFGSSRKSDRTGDHVVSPAASHGVIQKLPLENTFVEGKPILRSHGPVTVDQGNSLPLNAALSQLYFRSSPEGSLGDGRPREYSQAAPLKVDMRDYSDPHNALDVNGKLPAFYGPNRHSFHKYQNDDPAHYQNYDPAHYHDYDPAHYHDYDPAHYHDYDPAHYHDYDPAHYHDYDPANYDYEPGRYDDYEPGHHDDYEPGHHQDFDHGGTQEHADVLRYDQLLPNALMDKQPLYNLPLDSAPFSTFGSHTSPDTTYTCLPTASLSHNVPMTDL